MFTIAFTFKSGVVGHLDFKTLEQVQHWLPQFSLPEVMERHGIVSIVVSENPQKKAVQEAA